MKTITATDLARNLGAVTDQVAVDGECVTVVRQRRPYVVLVPVHEYEALQADRRELQRRGIKDGD
jgi:prevent-host-death family protein